MTDEEDSVCSHCNQVVPHNTRTYIKVLCDKLGLDYEKWKNTSVVKGLIREIIQAIDKNAPNKNGIQLSFEKDEFELLKEVVESLIECYGSWEEEIKEGVKDPTYTEKDWKTYMQMAKKLGIEIEDDVEKEAEELAKEIIGEAKVEYEKDRCESTTQTMGVSGDKWQARCQLKKGHAGSHKRGKIVWD